MSELTPSFYQSMLSAFEFIFYLFGEHKNLPRSAPHSASSTSRPRSRPPSTPDDASDDTDAILPTNTLIELASFLFKHDTTRPPEYIREFEEAIRTADDGAYKDSIGFQQFAGLPIVQSL